MPNLNDPLPPFPGSENNPNPENQSPKTPPEPAEQKPVEPAPVQSQTPAPTSASQTPVPPAAKTPLETKPTSPELVFKPVPEAALPVKPVAPKKPKPKTTESQTPAKKVPQTPPKPAPKAEPISASSSSQSGGIAPRLVLSAILGLGLLGVLIFYLLLFWGLTSGNTANPLFETLGIKPDQLQGILILMTNLIFGGTALLCLIVTLTSFFRWSIMSADNLNKSRLLWRAGTSLFFFFFSCATWFFLYYFIDQLAVRASDLPTASLIETTPVNVIGLSAPVVVNFDLTKNLYSRIKPEHIRQIAWDFDGDGRTDASEAIVSHRFLDRGENNGRFVVTADVSHFSTIENKVVTFQTSREVIISNESIVAQMIASPESGDSPLEVEFNAAGSRDPDGAIILYEWDLDDDGEFEIRQEDPNLTEIFTKVGTYEIALRVTGRNSDTAILKKEIEVQTPESDLQAIINSQQSLTGFAPLAITFDGSKSFIREGNIAKYEWQIQGENEPVLGRKLQRVFRNPNEYDITLTVENDLGERHKTTKTVVVKPDEIPTLIQLKTTPPLAEDAETLTGAVPFTVVFDAKNSGVNQPVEWAWDFESDGLIDEYGPAVKKIFREPGIFAVKLTITDSQQRTFDTKLKVQVEAVGTVALIDANPVSGEIPLTVEFDGSGSSTDDGQIVNYIWELPGQKPRSQGARVSYLFEQVGNYPIRMSVLTSKGQTATTEIIVSARTPQMIANFTARPTVGSAPLNVEFTPGITTGVIREYRWDFGDDSPVKRVFRPENVSHTYLTPGTYSAKLTMIDTNNLVASKTLEIEVK